MTDDSTKTLGLSISCDEGRFFRHECPRCAMEFKRQGNQTDIEDLLSSTVRHLLPASETDEGADEQRQETRTHAWCVYCGYSAEKQAFLHPEIVRYVRSVAIREIVEPMLEKAFAGFGTDGEYGGGLISFEVSISRPHRQRPILGPEPNDQVVVHCLACGERFKVMESWRGPLHCPACSFVLVAQ